MESSWQKINPQTKFGLVTVSKMYTNQRKSLDLLYQPILGNNSYTLVNILWQIADACGPDINYHSHFELLSLLNLGFKDFYQARLKLEGTGLLKTLVQTKNSEIIYIYELLSPISARAFFNDDLLSLALLENTGETHYQHLIDHLFPSLPKFKHAQDVSKNFLEVFDVTNNKITHHPKINNQSFASKSTYHNSTMPQVNSEFDFTMLLNILKSSYVNLLSVKKAHQLIVDINSLYGIDEINMAKLIEKSTNITTNFFDANKLKILVTRLYQSRNKKTHVVDQLSSSHEHNNFSDEENQLIKISKEYAPMEFLFFLKDEKHGMISSNERWTVKNIVNQCSLPTSVINILIYHVLVNEERSNLKRSYVDTIADNWSQKEINSPEKAIQYIKLRDDKAANAKSKKNYYHHKKTTIKETLPDWAKDDYHPKYEKASLAERKRVKEKLAQLNRNMKEGK